MDRSTSSAAPARSRLTARVLLIIGTVALSRKALRPCVENGFGSKWILRSALFNALAKNDDGSSKGLPPKQVPEEPEDCVVVETVRRSKGLEREVAVLVEVPETAVRFDQLLYVGLTRATTQLVVIAPPGLARILA